MTRAKPTRLSGAPLIAHDETWLLDGAVVFLQPQKGYRSAIDPVFLAAAVNAKPGDRVLDVGSGTGCASLCLAARVSGLRITGLELQSDYVNLAKKSAELNGWREQINFLPGDLAEMALSPDLREFDHVMTNPPYMERRHGRISPDKQKALATAESHLELHDWLQTCARMTRSKGTVTVIHRADRLEHILAAFSGILGGLMICPLWPYEAQDSRQPLLNANRVIVRGRKGSKTPGQLKRGLTLHRGPTGAYTELAAGILNGTKSIVDMY